MDIAVFASALTRLWPHGNSRIPGLIEGTIASAPAVFAKYGTTSPLVIAHAMAEFSEECNAGLEMVEDMNYSAARLLKIFPTHFSTAQAITMQHQPKLIADQAYDGRMGNRIGTDDGWNFRGHGFPQATGLNEYMALAKLTGLDLVNDPELVSDPAHALECGVADFIQCGCLPYAEKDMLVGVASMLNVGHYVSDPNRINGFAMRKSWLALWKHALGVQ
jgi:putative chitinase